MQSDNRIDLDALEREAFRAGRDAEEYLAELKKFDADAVTLANLQQAQEIAQENFISLQQTI